jgi:hypothetical protein
MRLLAILRLGYYPGRLRKTLNILVRIASNTAEIRTAEYEEMCGYYRELKSFYVETNINISIESISIYGIEERTEIRHCFSSSLMPV